MGGVFEGAARAGAAVSAGYTPGPWIAAPDEGCVQIYCDAARVEVIATVHGQNQQTDADNARLIAAAPELAEALAGARDALAELNQSENDAGALLGRIDAALAKAGL